MGKCDYKKNKLNNRFDKRTLFVQVDDDDYDDDDDYYYNTKTMVILTGFSKAQNAVIVVVHSCNKIKYG